MYCNKCGEQLPTTATKCEKCGAKTNGNITAREFMLYDYKTVDANRKNVYEVMDWYENLGWELINCNDENSVSSTSSLNFKRDRKIKNKDQLLKIQNRMDDAVGSINILENKKTSKAVGTSLGLGVVGTLTFGGGMCLCLLNSASLLSMIGGCALGVVGLGICGLAYLAYKKIVAKKQKQINPMIVAKKDEIVAICEQASKLI